MNGRRFLDRRISLGSQNFSEHIRKQNIPLFPIQYVLRTAHDPYPRITESQHNAPKAQIMSSCVLQDNFDETVGLHQTFIAQMKPCNDDDKFNVSGVEQGGAGAKGGSGRGGAAADTAMEKEEEVEEATEEVAEEAVGEAKAEGEIASESKAVMLGTDQKSKLKTLRLACNDGQDTRSTA